MSRPEAIRAMLDAVLVIVAKEPGNKPPKQPTRSARAVDLAAAQIDKMSDPGAPPGERAQRRHQLTKGPEEFREVRVDRPKAKK